MPVATATDVTSADSIPVGESLPPISLSQFGRRLYQTLQSDDHDAISKFLKLVRDLIAAEAVVYCTQHRSGDLTKSRLLLEPASPRLRGLRSPLTEWSLAACKSQSPHIASVGKQLTVITAPIPHLSGAGDSLACIVPLNENQVQTMVVAMEVIAKHFARWRQNGEVPVDDASWEVLEILKWIACKDNLRGTCRTLADALLQVTAGDAVFVSLRSKKAKSCRVKAIAGHERFDASSEICRRIEELSEEVCLRGEAKSWSKTDLTGATEAVRKLLYLSSSATVRTAPLKLETGDSIGAIVTLESEPRPSVALDRYLAQVATFVAPCLLLRRQADGHGVVAGLRKTAKAIRTKPVILGIGVALVAVLALPFTHKVQCRCVVQPVTRRVITAPYEGTLETALVKPGDTIRRDQIVARMDGREIRWELAALAAELSQAQKQRDVNVVSGDTATAQIAELEFQRLQLQIRLLEHRAENLEIKSPIDGIVVSGDATRSEGSRLTIGQPLMEIGPLEQVKVEVLIDDHDIAHVQNGLPVSVRLDSHPRTIFEGELTATLPRAEERDSRNVFVGEAYFPNEQAILRPGMRGRAKVHGRHRPLAWILFHRAWYQLIFRLGW